MDTCSWKISVESVPDDEEYGSAIVDQSGRRSVSRSNSGDRGVWDVSVETEDGEQSASWGFVTFSGRPTSEVVFR